jgi:hypothetical protein
MQQEIENQSRLDQMITIISRIVKKPGDYSIYKKNAAAQFSLLAGSPKKIKSNNGDFYVTNKGCIFVNCANSIAPKKYNWQQKVNISLDEHEIAKLILGLKTGQPVDFYHDKFKGKEREGEVITILKLSSSNKGGDKLFLNMKRMDKQLGENVISGVSIERHEAKGLCILLEAAIPKIMGWT